MFSPKLVFFLVFAAVLPFDAHAVPGPLISGGVGLISSAWAMVAVVAGFVAMALASMIDQIRYFRRAKPALFYASVGVAILVASASAYLAVSSSGRESSPVDRLRSQLTKRAEESPSNWADVPFSTLVANLETAWTWAKFSDTKLEEEIAYSIGRNNNVVWSRYLSSGKVPNDAATLESMARGEYELPLERLFEGGTISSKYEIIDLRTPIEFATSAHFKGAKNLEYRAIVNDEIAFDKAKTYVFICHDGAADLSRSLIATAYERSKGFKAYALATGMRPVLDRMWIPPVSFSAKTEYRTYDAGSPPAEGTVVDTLWALSETLQKKGYAPGYSVESFPFYRLWSSEYGAGLRKIAELTKGGWPVRFACYDTFSCFYARVFVETYSRDGASRYGIAIFR